MAVRSWQQKSRNKFRTSQTRFGMGSEKLSTHPSGKKTSAAHFEHLPTRRLVVQFKLTTRFDFITTRKSFYRTFSKNELIEHFYRVATREATASKKSAGLGHPS